MNQAPSLLGILSADYLDPTTLVTVLAHTLWQAPLWGVALWLGLRIADPRNPARRYFLTLIALAAVVVSPLVTWSVLRFEPTPRISQSSVGRTFAAPITTTDIAAPTGDRAEHFLAEGERAVSDAAVTPVLDDSARSLNGDGSGFYSWMASVLALLWMAGALAMLTRLGRDVVAARGLADGPRVTDPAILEILRRVQRSLSLRTSIRVVASDHLSTPLVVGVLRPTLVLPLSLMTGLAPAEWQAIFAHELAHVRRHDALVNVLQLLVEALLFFNPAVWWISHQVRLEREACCDATAASLLASPLGYAEVLLAWVERVRRTDRQVDDTAIPGVAFGTTPGLLVDRIERLVSPGYRPIQRVSLKTCLLIASMAIAGYLLLQRGSDLAVMVAGQLLSDQQRVDRLVEVRREVGAEAASKPGTYTITGTIRTVDDQPLRTVSVTLRTLSPGSSRSVGRTFSGGNFQFEVQTGKSWIGVHVEGYAPVFRGPFSGEADTTLALEEIELKRGFDSAVRVNDTRGAPIEGAQLRLSATIDGQGMLSLPPTVTETAGTAVLQNLSDHAFRVHVEADGFQPLIAEPLTFAPDEERVLVMQPARPTSGIVLTEQGVPAAGIEVWRSLESRPGVQDLTHRKLAVSDAEGRFSLTQLRDDSIYTIHLMHQDRVAAVIDDVEAGDGDLRWRLTPPLTVRGRVIGLPSAEEETPDEPELALFSMNRVGDREETRVGNPRTPQRVMLDEQGVFTIENLSPGSLALEIGSRRFEYELADSQDDLVVDLSGPEPVEPKREVHITFVSPTGPAPIQGTSLFFTTSQSGGQADGGKTESLEVQLDGPTLHIEAFAPGIISGSPGQVVGFWFEAPRIEIPAGEGPFETTIEVIPAGAMTGRVLDADGHPVTSQGVNVSCSMRYRPEPRHALTRSLHNIRVNERGEFFLSPIILGAETLVSVTDGHNVQIAQPLMLTAASPTDEVTLRLTPVVDVAGVVLDQRGDPIPRLPFRLRFEQGPRNITFGSGWVTAHDGSFLIEGISDSVGQYFLEIDSRRDYVPLRQPLRRDGQPLEIRLQEGLAIVGVVTDQSGTPVPGVEVYARPIDGQQDLPPFFEAEAASDAEGRFRLSNLPDRMMQVHARQMRHVEDLQVRPGRKDLPPHVSLQGQEPDWHRERARPVRP